MNPTQAPIQPQTPSTNPQGVASPGITPAPTPPTLPQAQAAPATPAPVQTPNFDTSGTLNDIAAYYQIPRDTAAISGAGQAKAGLANAQFEYQKGQNAIKMQHQQDALDPTKYQFTKNPDGSVTILNSVGDKVDVGTYAALTGANPAEALQKAGATDQKSNQFITAYNNLQNYIQLKTSAQNGDAQAQAEVQDYQKANPGLANMELGQLQTEFMKQYGSYFGQPQDTNGPLNGLGITDTLSSVNNPASTSIYGNQEYNNLLTNQSSTYTPSPVSKGSAGSVASSTNPSDLLNSIISQNNTNGK